MAVFTFQSMIQPDPLTNLNKVIRRHAIHIPQYKADPRDR